MKIKSTLHSLFLALIGVQLIVLGGCATQPATSQISSPGTLTHSPQWHPPGRTGTTAQNKRPPFASRDYERIVNRIVAHSVRSIRVYEERRAAVMADRPVALPVGGCRAIVTVAPTGKVIGLYMGRCASPSLEFVERKAIRNISPLPSPGHTVEVIIRTWAPIATPGIYGN